MDSLEANYVDIILWDLQVFIQKFLDNSFCVLISSLLDILNYFNNFPPRVRF